MDWSCAWWHRLSTGLLWHWVSTGVLWHRFPTGATGLQVGGTKSKAAGFVRSIALSTLTPAIQTECRRRSGLNTTTVAHPSHRGPHSETGRTSTRSPQARPATVDPDSTPAFLWKDMARTARSGARSGANRPERNRISKAPLLRSARRPCRSLPCFLNNLV